VSWSRLLVTFAGRLRGLALRCRPSSVSSEPFSVVLDERTAVAGAWTWLLRPNPDRVRRNPVRTRLSVISLRWAKAARGCHA